MKDHIKKEQGNETSIDNGRVFGSWQVDEFKSHNHSKGAYNTGLWVAKGGTFGGYTQETLTDYAGGVETRPRNIALMGIIKY